MILLALLLLAAPPAPARDAPASDAPASDEAAARDEDEDEEAGWGDGDDSAGFAQAPAPKLKAPPPSRAWWRLSGAWRSDWAAWLARLGDDPWAKGRQGVEATLDLKGAAWRARLQQRVAWDAALFLRRDEIDAESWSTYAFRLIGGEQYVALDGARLSLVFGRQIVAWGEGDLLSPLDVVNPRDDREIGLAEIEDLRLPTLATRLRLTLGASQLEAIALHEAAFNERPPPLGEFSPLPALLAAEGQAALLTRPMRWDDQGGGDGLAQQGGLLRWLYKGAGLDLGLYAGSVLDREGVLAMPPLLEVLQGGAIRLPVDHPRYTLVGLSGATSLGALLIKWEAVGELDRRRNTGGRVGPLYQLGEAETTLYTGALGLTYSGLRDTLITLEGQRGLLIDPPTDLLYPVDREILALRLSHKLLRERLELQGVVTALGVDAEGGWLARLEARYAWLDALKLTLGSIHYAPGDGFSPLMGLDRHDRLYARLRWDFELRDR
ncbi:hypothetical protein KKB55_03885 [Myxococcota bacterium]|nr:hypothetical protein [Myxococcota bacterium]MBU1896890.1 hypothetical protein [Myxococcota bacterium]